MNKVALSKTAADYLVAEMHAKGWTEVDLSRQTGLDRRTISSAIAGKNVSLSTIFRIEEALEIAPSTLMQLKTSKESASSVVTENNSLFEKWHSLFWNALQPRLNLSSNASTSLDGLCFDRRKIYVPLHLSKRSRRPRYLVKSLLHPKSLLSITQPIYPTVHAESLDQILNSFLPKNNINARIAFCGPSGSGKTTLLQTIADFVSSPPHYGFVIWISSEDFLKAPSHLDPLAQLMFLLPSYANMLEVEQEELRSVLSQSSVWVILDGVDEVTRNLKPNQDWLSYLQQLNQKLMQLSGVANFVVSSHSEMWDTIENPLRENFDVYDLMEFSVGEGIDLGQLGQAITNLFPLKAAKFLKEYLQVHPHLKSVLSLPIYLLSLRYTWHLWGNPDKFSLLSAELHSQFAETLYDRCCIPQGDERTQLNHAASVLALSTIEYNRLPSRLRKEEIHKTLQTHNISLDFLNQLVKVGILKSVGVNYENSKEEVYAFLNPILRDYFAANSVASHAWPFFFNPNPQDLKDQSFRAQELRWWEVILIWFSRSDVNYACKEALLTALINFEDECGGFYYFRSYCLVAAAMQQYPFFSERGEVIRQIVGWSLGEYDSCKLRDGAGFVPDWVSWEAARMLLIFDPAEIKHYIDLVIQGKTYGDTMIAALHLAQIESFREIAFQFLYKIAINSTDVLEACEAVIGLMDLGCKDTQIKENLVSNLELRLESSKLLNDDWIIVNTLFEVAPQHPAIALKVNDLLPYLEHEEERVSTLLHQASSAHPLSSESFSTRISNQKKPKANFDPLELDTLIDTIEQSISERQVEKTRLLMDRIVEFVLQTEQNLLVLLWGDRLLKLFRVLKKWSYFMDDEDYWGLEVIISGSKLDQALKRCSEELPYIVFRYAWRKCDSQWESLL